MKEIQHVECMNNAAFVMSFGIQLLDENSGLHLIVDGLDTGAYPVLETRVIDLATIGIEPGAILKPHVRARWGIDVPGDRYVRFQPNGHFAVYDVRGTTLNFTVQLTPIVKIDFRP